MSVVSSTYSSTTKTFASSKRKPRRSKSRTRSASCRQLLADRFLAPGSWHFLTMKETQRLWLMFPAKLITRPVIWELGKKFEVVTNVRQASVTDEIGLMSLSLEGDR